VQSGSGDFNAPTTRVISLLLVVYVYDASQNTFKQLPDMPANLPVQIYNARKALHLIEEGGRAIHQHSVYGSDCLNVPVVQQSMAQH